MTAVLPDRPSDVIEADEADLRAAIASALARCGLTFAQLKEQARRDDFESTAARLAWLAIGDLGHLAE